YEHLCGWDGGCLAGDYDSREINDLIFEFLGVEKSVLRCEEKKIHGGISSKVNVKFPGIQRERAFQIIKEKAK
ncbi:MAG: hypothetical protein GTO02_00730, partial [Candidatus Dadabacteria bacterium]|nr:hypothetical protein [Candidatus Dadabacteria bacterium]